MARLSPVRIHHRVPRVPALTLSSASEGSSAVPYGELEKMLSRLIGADVGSVRSRFRKLRLRPFPDDIQSGTGVRVRYDLRRVVAIAAVFELNNLYIPQGHAIDLVQATWPEWSRATIAAAARADLLPVLGQIPDSAGPIVEIGCRGLSNPAAIMCDAKAVSEIDQEALGFRPSIAIDVTSIVSMLAEWAKGRGLSMVIALREDLEALDSDFGWSHLRIEAGDSDTYLPGSSFLVEGPYFERALSFLEAVPSRFDRLLSPASRYRLQVIYRYLERPPPIDAYKGELGFAHSELPLRVHLHFHAKNMGLETLEIYPEVMHPAEPRESALQIIRSARHMRRKP